MFTYRCLRCGKQHHDARSFEKAFQTRCLRCDHVFDVTADRIHATSSENKPSPKSQAITTQTGKGNRSTPVATSPPENEANTQITPQLDGEIFNPEIMEELERELTPRKRVEGTPSSNGTRRSDRPVPPSRIEGKAANPFAKGGQREYASRRREICSMEKSLGDRVGSGPVRPPDQRGGGVFRDRAIGAEETQREGEE